MKVATLLFTYKRSYHTERVVDSLKNNTILPSKLFVFQDGLKDKEDVFEWNKVNSFIKKIDWCDKEIIVSKTNQGLANSILSGINYVFREYDAVIVLEDDCVPAANFINFMYQCFEKYKNTHQIYSVSGYAYPIEIKKDNYDIYGCGRISSWGWGTWKDRWIVYKKDYEFIKKMKQEKMASKNLAIWGKDLEEMLVGNVRGICDSWAVFWALTVISKGGICINPYESLIENIGLDGSGVHCRATDKFDVKIDTRRKKEFNLPEQIGFLNETMEAFAPLYGSYTAISYDNESKERILIYGMGRFFMRNEKEINERYNIEAIVDQMKQGWFAGKKIIKPEDIKKYIFNKILIMIYDIQECIKIVNWLITKGIDNEQILLGLELFGPYSRYIDKITVQSDGKLSISVGEIIKTVTSKIEYDNLCKEVLNT